MHFIFKDEFWKKIRSIRKDYEARALNGKSLETLSEPYKIFTFFGAIDPEARLRQLYLIENFNILFDIEKKCKLDFKTEQDIQNYIADSRVALGVIYLYIRSEIDATYIARSGTNSDLAQLLEEALIEEGIVIDDETYACSVLAAQRYINSHQLQTINALLQERTNSNEHAYISELEWHKLSTFINNACSNLDKKWQKEYPITSITMPLFSMPMQAAGYSAGWLLGDLAGKSYSMLPARYAVTALFGGGLILLFGPAAGRGIMLLAPTYAGQLFDTFFGVSLAYILGSALGLVGKGLGFGVGMTLDISWKLISGALSLVYQTIAGVKQPPKLTGFNLVNGHRVVDGIELNIIELAKNEKELQEQYKQYPITFTQTEEGFIVEVGADKAMIKWKSSPDEVLPYMQELASRLNEKQSKVIVEEITENTDDIHDNLNSLMLTS